MQEQYTLHKVECLDNEKIVCAIASFAQQPFEAADQSHSDVPLEALLEFVELSECGIEMKLTQLLGRRRRRGAECKHRVSLVGCRCRL